MNDNERTKITIRRHEDKFAQSPPPPLFEGVFVTRESACEILHSLILLFAINVDDNANANNGHMFLNRHVTGFWAYGLPLTGGLPATIVATIEAIES